MLKKLSILLAIVIMVAIGYSYKPETISVTVITADSGLVEQVINNSRAGSVKACKRSKLSMSMGGRVKELLVEQGDKVKQGQTLLTLWNDDQLAVLKQNQALLEAAELGQQEICLQSNYAANEAKRQTELDKQHLASQHNVEQALTTKESAAKACSQAKVMVKQASATVDMQLAIIEQTKLVAPFDGIVAEINGEVGEYVTPSPPGVPTPPAVDLINTDCLYVTVPIDEIDASQLQLDQKARVSLDAFNQQEFEATLVRISPYVKELERQARTVDVDLKFDHVPDNVQLLIGYSADASIIVKQHNSVLRIPTQYLAADNQISIVNPHGEVEIRQLDIGLQNWTWTEVTGGLNKGDLIITSSHTPKLQPGDQVVIVK